MLFIKNGDIKPIVGTEIENGCLLIDDNGKIAAIGADLVVPENNGCFDFKGESTRSFSYECNAYS